MLKRFLQKSSIYFLGMILNRGLAILLLPIYTFYLRPEDYGILAICSTVTTLLGIFLSFSLENAIVLFRYQLEPLEYRKYLTTLWAVTTFAPILLVVALDYLGRQFGTTIFASVAWHPFITVSLWIAYLSVVQSIALNIFRAEEKAVAFMILSFAIAISTAVFAVYFLSQTALGVVGVLYAQLVSYGLLGAVAHFIILRECLPWAGFSLHHIKSAFLLYIPILPHVICIWLLNLSDRWILERYVSLSEIGIYNLAYTIGAVVYSIGNAQSSSFTPIYFKNAEYSDFRARMPSLITAFVMIPTYLGICLAVLSKEILAIMTHPNYYPAAFFVPWIIMAYWFYVSIYQLHLMVIEYHRKNTWVLFVSLPACLLNIALNLVLIPHYGILAAAVNTTIAFATMACLTVFFVSRLERFPVQWLTITKFIALGIGIYFISYYLFASLDIRVSLPLKTALLMATGLAFFLIGNISFTRIKSLFQQSA